MVDFEFLSHGVAGADAADLWTDLVSAADRERLVEGALTTFPRCERRLRVLLHWSAVRHLADLVALPRQQWDLPEIDTAMERVREARRLRLA